MRPNLDGVAEWHYRVENREEYNLLEEILFRRGRIRGERDCRLYYGYIRRHCLQSSYILSN
jgi:hypothetical protein